MSMQIIEKNEGTKIEWEEIKNKVFFNDEIMVDVSKRERDYPVNVDICMDKDRNLVIGAAAGLFYVAQIEVPAAQYVYPEPVAVQSDDAGMAEQRPPEKIPFSMDNVKMTLWSMDDLEEIKEEDAQNEL
ncbi:MAG: hypothetical protein EUB_03422 [Eubacterium sp.]|uniref:hypothetical protein n=1 Tax=Eubacterium sp. TaxID=142586 RepID=UPI00302446AD